MKLCEELKEYKKVVRVIYSCKTKEQIAVAAQMVKLFNKKHNVELGLFLLLRDLESVISKSQL